MYTTSPSMGNKGIVGSLGSKGGTVVSALTSHQCGPGSNPGGDAICLSSLLLVLAFA